MSKKNSPTTLKVVISETNESKRADKFLSELPEIRTRSRAAKLIATDLVLVDGKPIKPSHLTKLGEVFEINFPPPEPSTLEPWDFQLDILHEDDDIIVVNKPAGMVVHPAAGHSKETLVNALIHHTKNLSMGFSEQRPGIVHRLDKETSGILVVAKNDVAHENLAQQFKDRTVHRIYLALTFGVPKLDAETLTSNLGRHPVHRKKFCSVKVGGKVAITHYKKVGEYKNQISLLKVKLETGRTHQIRVHLAERGYPILGDWVYTSQKRLKNFPSVHLRKEIGQWQRIALHAAELGFVHPCSGEEFSFHSGWPMDLCGIAEVLGFSEVEFD